MRLIGRVFVQWKDAWQVEQRLNEQKHRALLFWALQLQKRVSLLRRASDLCSSLSLQCFVTWLIYLSERKRKKARYNEATHRRHADLFRQSLRQFLVYTDHTRQRRQALFLHQQVYVSDASVRCALATLVFVALSRSKRISVEVPLQMARVRQTGRSSASTDPSSDENEPAAGDQSRSIGTCSIR